MHRWMFAWVSMIVLGVPASVHAQKVPRAERAGIIARVLERLRTRPFDHPLLRRQQRASLDTVYWEGSGRVVMPTEGEIARFRDLRRRFDVEALGYLDEMYGTHTVFPITSTGPPGQARARSASFDVALPEPGPGGPELLRAGVPDFGLRPALPG